MGACHSQDKSKAGSASRVAEEKATDLDLSTRLNGPLSKLENECDTDAPNDESEQSTEKEEGEGLAETAMTSENEGISETDAAEQSTEEEEEDEKEKERPAETMEVSENQGAAERAENMPTLDQLHLPAEGIEERDGHTYFCVRIVAGGDEEWTVSRRYNDFHALHRALGKKSTKASFPRKHMRTISGNKLEERRRALEEWLIEVVEQGKHAESDENTHQLLKFLKISN